MKQKFYTPHIKNDTNTLMVGVDIAHLPSMTHKFGAINNKAQRFEDRRFKKPKYKVNYMED